MARSRPKSIEQFFSDPEYKEDADLFRGMFDKMFEEKMKKAKEKAKETGGGEKVMNIFDWLAGADDDDENGEE